ncbi:transmembrane amino acid transporter protein-domain-containing protein [Ochromonadaceae sp. CCMP2298]|nr:transmembrane amino acid transporter protein-domain-containing protein [Ochromonadaceae sp. CCMP2298]
MPPAPAARPAPPAHQPPQFSFWVGVAFTLNYVVGSGFLTLPWAFQKTGIVLGILVLSLMCLMSILSCYFILETMERATRMINSIPSNTNSFQASSREQGRPLAAPVQRRMELTELCALFLGYQGKRVFSVLIMVYIYGTLWAYCTVFAKAFSAVFDLGAASYYIYLSVFAVIVVPLSCMELAEQVYVQVALSLFRVLMLTVMILTTAVAYFSRGGEFGELSNRSYERLEEPAHPDMNFDKLYLLLPIAAYAYIFHHSVPALSEPVADKRSVGLMFTVALLVSFVAYTVVSICVSLYFGSDTLSSSNLNWQLFEGHRLSDGSKPLWAVFVSVFVVLFPAMDVASAYPLNAFTLGNNIMSSYFGEEVEKHQGSRVASTFFRLVAAIPPFAGALVVSDLGNITAFTGLTGFAIAFIVPGMLALYSEQHLAALGMETTTIHSHYFTGPMFAHLLCGTGILLVLAVAISSIPFS